MDHFFSIKKLLTSLLQALGSHFRALYLDLDIIKDAHIYRVSRYHLLQQKTSSQMGKNFQPTFHLPYLFPTLTMFYLTVDSVLILQRISFQLGSTLPDASFLFSHRIFPQELWPQCDAMTLLGVALAFFIYVCLLTKPKLEEKYIMYLFVGDKGHHKNSSKTVELIQNGKGKSTRFSTGTK